MFAATYRRISIKAYIERQDWGKCLTCNHLRNRLQKTNNYNDAAETDASVSSVCLPRLALREFEEAQRG